MKKHILISQAIIHDKSRNEISDNLDTYLQKDELHVSQ